MLGQRDLEQVLDACPDAFVAVDAARLITHWSAGAERVLGWTADQVVGHPDPSVPPDSMAATAAAVRMLASGADPGRSWQAPRLTRDGRRIVVQLTGWVPLADPHAFGVFFREPDRDEQEAHLRNRLSSVLSAAVTRGDVVAAVDEALGGLVGATGTTVLAGCRCGTHLVADPEGRCERPEVRVAWVDRARLGMPGDPERAVVGASMHTTDEAARVCLVPMGPASSDMWLAVAGIEDPARVRHVLVTIRAVADEAWVALQRAELVLGLQGRVDVLEALDASRAEAIAGVTHDLKAPVHVLRGFVETLRSRPPGSVDPNQAFDAMERQIGRIARLVDDLLLAARAADGPIRPGRVAAVDVGELVHAIRDTLDPETRERVVLDLADGLEFPGDDDQVGRVLTNLVDNALKYGGDGGIVEVTAVAVADSGSGEGAGEVVVRVRDHGPGLAPGEQERVFGRFVIGRAGRETGSTGLGLHIAREIARGHGGDLRALPWDPGVPGAVFELRLPVGADAAAD